MKQYGSKSKRNEVATSYQIEIIWSPSRLFWWAPRWFNHTPNIPSWNNPNPSLKKKKKNHSIHMEWLGTSDWGYVQNFFFPSFFLSEGSFRAQLISMRDSKWMDQIYHIVIHINSQRKDHIVLNLMRGKYRKREIIVFTAFSPTTPLPLLLDWLTTLQKGCKKIVLSITLIKIHRSKCLWGTQHITKKDGKQKNLEL